MDVHILEKDFFRQRQLPRRRKARRYHNGERAAVARGVIGAKILLGIPVEASSLAEAAAQVHVSIHYVEWAAWVIQSEDPGPKLLKIQKSKISQKSKNSIIRFSTNRRLGCRPCVHEPRRTWLPFLAVLLLRHDRRTI
jgi:hypothetical protein